LAVKVEVGEVDKLKDPVEGPEAIDHVPVPFVGVFPPKEPDVNEPQTERVEGETVAVLGEALIVTELELELTH
jgi:hypothetical protein